MRGRLLNMPAIGRVAGFALVAAAIIATAVHFRHGVGGGPTAESHVMLTADPLAAALAHCQAMGAAAQGDGPCEAAWAENRRRFFTGGASTAGAATASVKDAAGAQTPSAKAR
jgi:conjugative transfer region protein TrbK